MAKPIDQAVEYPSEYGNISIATVNALVQSLKNNAEFATNTSIVLNERVKASTLPLMLSKGTNRMNDVWLRITNETEHIPLCENGNVEDIIRHVAELKGTISNRENCVNFFIWKTLPDKKTIPLEHGVLEDMCLCFNTLLCKAKTFDDMLKERQPENSNLVIANFNNMEEESFDSLKKFLSLLQSTCINQVTKVELFRTEVEERCKSEEVKKIVLAIAAKWKLIEENVTALSNMIDKNIDIKSVVEEVNSIQKLAGMNSVNYLVKKNDRSNVSEESIVVEALGRPIAAVFMKIDVFKRTLQNVSRNESHTIEELWLPEKIKEVLYLQRNIELVGLSSVCDYFPEANEQSRSKKAEVIIKLLKEQCEKIQSAAQNFSGREKQTEENVETTMAEILEYVQDPVLNYFMKMKLGLNEVERKVVDSLLKFYGEIEKDAIKIESIVKKIKTNRKNAVLSKECEIDHERVSLSQKEQMNDNTTKASNHMTLKPAISQSVRRSVEPLSTTEDNLEETEQMEEERVESEQLIKFNDTFDECMENEKITSIHNKVIEKESAEPTPLPVATLSQAADAESSTSENVSSESKCMLWPRNDIGSEEFMKHFKLCEKQSFDKTTNRRFEYVANGEKFMEEMAKDDVLHNPFLIENANGLGMTIANNLNFDTLEDQLKPSNGQPLPNVDVINTYKRSTEPMTVEQLLEEFKKPNAERSACYNCLSFETSNIDSRFCKEFKLPKYVVKKSLVHNLRNILNEKINQLLEQPGNSEEIVQKRKAEVKRLVKQRDNMPNYHLYVMLTMAGSFTEPHIDYSATSLYFYVAKGQKIFYFAPPTKENLVFFRDYEKYEMTEWIGKPLFNQWQRVVINEGGIAVVPAGYIHFVYTPLDSIAIGGSYLTEDSFELQFQRSKQEESWVKKNPKFKNIIYQGFRDVMFCYMEHILIPKLESGAELQETVDMFCKEMNDRQSTAGFSKKDRQKLLDELAKYKSEPASKKRNHPESSEDGEPADQKKRVEEERN
ncbi:hypothetical protein CRE_03280 [Caenorhabditis remanei]|uniref:JmjC domain-containing protein n=1 Tax=Caenorhabditis remanei TaxID=31234 RepID=E3MME4_CAERE|nr:hypothetical protein CRE_03280 [Caenorhabditis remanei]